MANYTHQYLLTSLSISLNLFFLYFFVRLDHRALSWTFPGAAEAEAVAAISCSGHGRAFLDGFSAHGMPVCECNSCYTGFDCSRLVPNCTADADSGDPMFLEPFWRKHLSESTVVIPGWHRMSYDYADGSYISGELESRIRELHAIARNAVTHGKYIVFGAGSTQLLNAAVYALSINNSSPAKVVAEKPFYPVYKEQTEFFNAKQFEFEGDAALLKSKTNTRNTIEFVTSPNNPDGTLKRAILRHPSAKSIHDYAYFWPHYTPIPSPADEDVMLFTLSKLTGHAGSRFGWAIVKDKQVYENMLLYKSLADSGTSQDTQLRALKLIKVVLENNGQEIFNFAHETMKYRWESINRLLSSSNRFRIQKIQPALCNYSQIVREASPAFAWLKCEEKEDWNCHEVLHREGNIIGRKGSLFGVEDRYVRLSLVKSEDDFNILLNRLTELLAKQNTTQSINISSATI